VPVRLREEVQEVLRRGDRELNLSPKTHCQSSAAIKSAAAHKIHVTTMRFRVNITLIYLSRSLSVSMRQMPA
jgi:hypothetical protein